MMLGFVRLAGAALALAGLAGAANDLRGVLAYERASDLASESSIRRSIDLEFAEASDAAALEAAKTAATVGVERGRAVRLYTRLLRESAREARTPERSLELMCETLSALAMGLKREPFDSALLLNWANVRQLLGRTECSSPYTSGDYIEVARVAVSHDPADADVAYRAALIALWGGNRERALELFRATLETSLSPSQGQRRMILNEIRSPEELAKVVPPRFPQAADWSAEFLRNREHIYSGWAAAFSALQRAAIEHSVAELDQGVVPPAIHQRRLEGLLTLELTDEVRTAADRELARLYARRGTGVLAKYFEARASMQELGIVRSTISSDTRPLKEPFVRWDPRGEVVFDEQGMSVGLYLASGQGLKLIEIHSRRPASSGVRPAALKIYVSDDGERWDEFAGATAELFTISGSSVFVISVPPTYRAYWKINYSGTTESKTFVNELRAMVRAYGASAR